MKRSVFISDQDLLEIETIDVTTISNDKSSTVIQLLIKLLIIFIIFAGFAVLITILIGLIFICFNCSRPSRIHKQIPIEYLDSDEISNYLDDTPTSALSEPSENNY